MNLTLNPRFRTLVFAFASLLPLLSVAIPQTQPGGSDLTAKVDKVFAQFDKPDSPGCALAVIKDGQIIYKRGYGFADLAHNIPVKPDTLFNIASMSKQFTAFAILMLARQGKLSLDDKAQKYITELREFEQPITIRHLLHHTSGLRDDRSLLVLSGARLGEDIIKDDDILDLVARMKELNFRPGEQYLYSNTGYSLLGYIVKRVSGQSLCKFAEANIFKPLGMTRTSYVDDHSMVVKDLAYGYAAGPGGAFRLSLTLDDTVGASGVISTVEDLARWDQNFYDKRVGGEWVIEQMQVRGALSDGRQISYARGLTLGSYKGLQYIDHSGSEFGYVSQLIRFPEQRFSVVCLCNVGRANPVQLARQVTDIYLASEFAPEPVRQAPVSPAITLTERELQTKVGAYWEARSEEICRISLAYGKLQISALGFTRTLSPLEANRFQVTSQPAEVVFETSAEGKSLRLTLKVEGRPPLTMEAMPPADTSNLSEYTGSYYSEEIDTTYQLMLKDGMLVVNRKKARPTTLQPRFRDAFGTLGALGVFRFTRDAQNRVNGFRLSAGRVRNFLFVKQPR